LPLIVTHGWPGSIIEQLKIIDPLTDPTPRRKRADASMCDSLDARLRLLRQADCHRLGPERIARAWDVLMKRLGTSATCAGRRLGRGHRRLMATQAAAGLLGIHTNMPASFRPTSTRRVRGQPGADGLSAEETRAYEQLAFRYQNGSTPLEMGSRPQSLTALRIPRRPRAFMIDHDPRSLELIARVFDGSAPASRATTCSTTSRCTG
jgi:hypothetical protein